MPTRISYNIHSQFVQDTPRLKAHLQAIQPASVLVMDGLGLAQELKALLPDCIVINRIYPDDDIHNHKSPTDWMNERAPQAAGGIFQYTTNESGFSPNLIQWHIELCNLAIQRNVPLVIGNMSVGTPAPEDWAAGRELFNIMNSRRDLFILGLHEYACGVVTSGFLGGYPNNAGVPPGQTGGMNLIPSSAWPDKDDAAIMTMYHCGRFKFLVDYCNSVGIQTPRIILTEHGMDDVSDIKPWAQTLIQTPPYTSIRGWRSCEAQWKAWYEAQGWTPQRSYFEFLKYLDKTVYQGSAVEAQLAFCWARPDNQSQWEQFDLSDARDFQTFLEQYAAEDQTGDGGNGGTEPPVAGKIDLLPYFNGTNVRTVYELGHNAAMGGGTELLQTQLEGSAGGFRHVKQGGAEQFSKWERLLGDANWIYRDLDTSGQTEVYRLKDSDLAAWSRWCPRYMAVGEKYHRNPTVTWLNKQTGQVVGTPRPDPSDIQLVAVMPTLFLPESGITLTDVIQLAWYPSGATAWEERYYYGKKYGLVAWENRAGWRSYVSVANSPHPAPIPEQLGTWAAAPAAPPSTPVPPQPTQPDKPTNAADPVTFANVAGTYNLRMAANKTSADIGDIRNGETVKAYRTPATNDGTNTWHFVERPSPTAGEASQGYSALPLPAPVPPDPQPPTDDATLILVRDHLVSVSHTLTGLASDLMADAALLDTLIAQKES